MTRAFPPSDTSPTSTRAWPPDSTAGLQALFGRALTDFTQTDPGIQSSVVQGAAVGAPWTAGQYINATLINPATISDLPSNGLRWTAPTKTLRRAVRGCNTVDLLQSLFVMSGDLNPTTLDVVLGCFFTNGTVGFGAGIIAAIADWQTFMLTQAAGVWTRAAGGAAVGTTQGVIGHWEAANLALGRVGRNVALDGTFTEQPAGSGGTVGNTALADNLNTFGIYTGWATGVGGTPGAVVKIAGSELFDFTLANLLAGT